VTESFIERKDGVWTVCIRDAPDGVFRSLSHHDRRDDALAWITTVMKSAGGGRYVVVGDDGIQVEHEIPSDDRVVAS
jgi:hypothetical protein